MLIYIGTQNNPFVTDNQRSSSGIEQLREERPEYFAHPVVDEDVARFANAQKSFKEARGHYASGPGAWDRLQEFAPSLQLTEYAETGSVKVEETDNGLGWMAWMEYDGLEVVARWRFRHTFAASAWSRLCWNNDGEKVLTGGKDTRDDIVADHPELE